MQRYFQLVQFVHASAHPRRRLQRTLQEAYQDVVDGLRNRRIPFVLHGAFALAAYGFERATADLDLLTSSEPARVEEVFSLMGALGAVPGQPGPRVARTAVDRGARHLAFNLSGWTIDFFLDPEFKALRRRAVRRRFGGRTVWVIARRDLVRRKRARGTKQDLADIERLEKG